MFSPGLRWTDRNRIERIARPGKSIPADLNHRKKCSPPFAPDLKVIIKRSETQEERTASALDDVRLSEEGERDGRSAGHRGDKYHFDLS